MTIDEAPFTLTTSNGFVILLDAVDADLASLYWGAYPNSKGKIYVYQHLWKKRPLMHRIIGARIVGRELAGPSEPVDHRNGNGLDNRRSNLRVVSRSINMQNRVGHDRRNRTGYRGVVPSRNGNRFIAQANHADRHIYLGTFDTPEAASEVIRAWRRENMPGYIEENS